MNTTSSTGATSGTGGNGQGGAGEGGLAAGSGGSGGQGGVNQGGNGSGGVSQGGGGPLTAAQCFADDFVTPLVGGPDYDQFGPIIGSHCMGTNHQQISNIDRVVFLGDSVTVGTPPTSAANYYRSQLADALAQKFGLNTPGFLWKQADFVNGTNIQKEDGAFASCAKWGARTDDLNPTQFPSCFPQNKLGQRTLVIITAGGNDLASLTQDAIDGAPMQQLWDSTMNFVQLQRDAIEWLTTPGRFPNGIFVVFANFYEFTDGTGMVESCDVSALAGFDEPIPSPAELAQMVIWANEQFLKIAVDTGSDMIFMLEDFCGHGFQADNPAAPCYRGPNTPQWFDLTCIHPNPAGHDHISDMFMAVVNE